MGYVLGILALGLFFMLFCRDAPPNTGPPAKDRVDTNAEMRIRGVRFVLLENGNIFDKKTCRTVSRDKAYGAVGFGGSFSVNNVIEELNRRHWRISWGRYECTRVAHLCKDNKNVQTQFDAGYDAGYKGPYTKQITVGGKDEADAYKQGYREGCRTSGRHQKELRFTWSGTSSGRDNTVEKNTGKVKQDDTEKNACHPSTIDYNEEGPEGGAVLLAMGGGIFLVLLIAACFLSVFSPESTLNNRTSEASVFSSMSYNR